MSSPIEEGMGRDLEKGLIPHQQFPALVLSNSGKRIDQAEKKNVKQVSGSHNDTELHLAARRGDLGAVVQILNAISSQMVGTLSGADFDVEVAEIRASVVNEVNELGETALFTAAEKGHLDVVKELLKYSSKDCTRRKNRSGFDALHIAAVNGHHAVVRALLDHDPSLNQTYGPSNATPFVSAATRGHTAVVNELLSKNGSLREISRSNGKNALHLAARQGHVGIVKALLDKDPQLARRTDKKGQTALHMAEKGQSSDVVKLPLEADAAIVMLPDKFGNTAWHPPGKSGQRGPMLPFWKVDCIMACSIEIVNGASLQLPLISQYMIMNEFLMLPDTNVNMLIRDSKTAVDLAEELPLFEESSDIKEILSLYGAVSANEINQARDELRKTVTQIKKGVHTQLERIRRTKKNVHNISEELRNNANNSVTLVAMLFAAVAFAAIFTMRSGDDNDGMAVMVGRASFKIFFIFNAISFFTSLAVVMVQITLVRGETKAERRVVKVINKLLWLASVCKSVAFMAASYIIVGRKHYWTAILVTVVGGVIMAGVLGTVTYYVVRSKRNRWTRKKEEECMEEWIQLLASL